MQQGVSVGRYGSKFCIDSLRKVSWGKTIGARIKKDRTYNGPFFIDLTRQGHFIEYNERQDKIQRGIRCLKRENTKQNTAREIFLWTGLNRFI
jgi:hypothetical protein